MSSGTTEPITSAEFTELTHSLVGLKISRPWRGYGSAIFMELGRLRRKPRPSGKGYFLKGRATVMIQWSWRVERKRSIAFGSWSGERKINNGIASLKNRFLEEILIEGRLPELYLTLSGNLWLHSFATAEGQPEWTVFLLDGSWITVDRGVLFYDTRNVK